jgi:hypothetical protein
MAQALGLWKTDYPRRLLFHRTRGNCVDVPQTPTTKNHKMTTEQDLDDNLQITCVATRDMAGGTWVKGTLSGHRFSALLFAGHADEADYELGESRITKLWIQRLADRKTAYEWDRGISVPATDELAGLVADFLAGGLADYLYKD